MCAAHRRSEARPTFAGPDAVAPPSVPPRAPALADRLRAARARRRGVVVGRDVVLAKGVVFDLAPGASLTLGDGVVLGTGCRFHVGPDAVVQVGAGSHLGERCAVTALRAVTIGARCVVGDEVVFIDAMPNYDDADRPIREQGLEASPIAVGDGVHIGPSAALLHGASVVAGTRIAAHTTLS